jgi:hypothetical protein
MRIAAAAPRVFEFPEYFDAMNPPLLLRAGLTSCFSLLIPAIAGADEKPAATEKPATVEAKVTTGFSAVGAGFKLDPVLPPAINDAAEKATFLLVDGTRDGNGGSLDVLHDGKVPAGDDVPGSNFFFAGGKGGRIAVDLGSVISVQSVATYSWHGGVRAPQVYKLYGADGTAKDFSAAPKTGTDPASCGWKLIASVDTHPKQGEPGGQHAASITSAGTGALGDFRHLLFDIQRSSESDPFGQTFFSEIDVVDAKGPELQRLKAQERIVKPYPAPDGKFRYVVDSSAAPDLGEWAEKKLIPVIHEWYPKIVEMLPSDGYTAPAEVLFQFKTDMKGTPAYAQGNQISLNVQWFRKELDREARGSVVHEMVHVVQNYWIARRNNRNATRNPGWIVEGIPDYIRWFLYEPQTKGAEITERNWDRAKYDDSYRTTGNFLNWITKDKSKDLVKKLNAACREGKYTTDLWKEWTGKTIEELGAEWKQVNGERLGKIKKEPAPAKP